VNSSTENYTYDDADKLTHPGWRKHHQGALYDSGRTTSVVSGGNTTSLTYDYEGRITQITYPNSSTNTFTYNGLDTRVSKVDSGGTKTYLRDGAGVTAPVLNDGAANYTPGTSERRSSTTTYYHGGIKNAETQSNTQTVTASVTFDARERGHILGHLEGPSATAGRSATSPIPTPA
jgi:YD repeat-containing protein